MRFAFYVAGVLLLTACAKPAHYFGTEQENPRALAEVFFNSDEVKLVEIDGQPFTGKQNGAAFYMRPGTHSFVARLHWVDLVPAGGVFISSKKETPALRKFCINVSAGGDYYLYAREPGPNWRFLVLDSRGREQKEIPNECP